MTTLRATPIRSVPLGKVVEFERESVQPQEIAAGTNYLGLEHLSGDGSIVGPIRVSQGDLASTKFVFSREHVLYGKLRPYLNKVSRPTFDGVCSTDIIPIKPRECVLRNYLYYWLRSPKVVAMANARSAGANLPRISPGVLATFEIPLPSIAEQERIGSILDLADGLRRDAVSVLGKADDLAKSIFAHQFKPWIAASTCRAFAELCAPLVDCRNKTAPYAATGVPLIRTSNFRGGRLDLKNLAFVTEETNRIWSARYQPRPGDIVYCREAPFGMAAMIPDDFSPCLGQRIMVAHANESLIRPLYLLYALNSAFVFRQADQLAVGATVRHLRVKDVEELRIPVPPMSEQVRFEKKITTLENVRHRAQVRATKAASLADALQNQFFHAAHDE